MKTAGPIRVTQLRGIDRNHFIAQFFDTVWNLLRMAKIATTENAKPPGNVAAASGRRGRACPDIREARKMTTQTDEKALLRP